ncbi:MAG TPA: hypothetical protein VF796_17800 [Humisphaera sp.]
MPAYLDDATLGIALVRLGGGRAGDRNLLWEIGQAADRAAATEADPERRRRLAVRAAQAATHADRRDDALRLIDRAAKHPRRPHPDPLLEAFAGDAEDRLVAMLRVRFEGLPADALRGLDVEQLFTVELLLAVQGDDAAARSVRAAILKKTAGALDDELSLRRRVVQMLARAGEFGPATATADAAPAGTSNRAYLLVGVAEEQHRRGDATGRDRSLDMALAAAVREPERHAVRSGVFAVLDLASAWGSKDVLRRAADAMDQHLAVGKAGDDAWRSMAALALAYDQLGDAAKRDAWRARAAEAVDRQRDGWERSDGLMLVAAAHAAAGDHTAADQYVARAITEREASKDRIILHPIDLVRSYCRAGDYDRALAVVKRVTPLPADQSHDVLRIVRAAARAAKYELAERVAENLQKPVERLEAHGAIVAARAAVPDRRGLAAWIDARPSPRHRVVLDLIVAAKVAGTPVPPELRILTRGEY